MAIGAGMATPYLVLLAFPHWAPRGGLGGDLGRTVNRLLGFGLLAGALYYGQEFLPEALRGRGSVVTMGLLALVWLVATRLYRAQVSESIGAGAAAILAGGVFAMWLAAPASPPGLQWQPISRAEAHPGEVEEPALLEFTADWCINCKVLERTVYRSADVAAAAGDAVGALQLDLTNFDRDAQALLQSWDGTGLPYAVVIDSSGHVRARLRDLATYSNIVAI